MFFSPDLLSKRDSGFGLLWLAATLGSKSAFKKLPKRSVMTADISQLCRLIATPTEPLALRLSSNLLVGAARVYKVKQEIFMSDVTTCFNFLKRVEHEFRSMTSSEGQLQMMQPTIKPSAVTLRADPRAAFSMEFDAMVTILNWDEYMALGGESCMPQASPAFLTLEITGNKNVDDSSNDDYRTTATKGKGKVKVSSSLPPDSEIFRATACTLPENHDFLLANSFDASFGGSAQLSFSQTGGFGFDDTFDWLDIGEGVGDDLVRELGEGWGASPVKENLTENLLPVREPLDINFDGGDFGDEGGFAELVPVVPNPCRYSPADPIQGLHTEESPSLRSLADTTKSANFQAVTHSPRCLPIELTVQHTYKGPVQAEVPRKTKRTRPVLDARTELTDEELEVIRMHYLDKQNNLRCELEHKRFEKRQDDLIHNLLWEAPGSVHAKELVDFWVNHFKAHVEARSGLFVDLQYLEDGAARQKRRKVTIPQPKPLVEDLAMMTADKQPVNQGDTPVDGNDAIDFSYHINVNWRDVDDCTPNTKNLRSSEEPGQARRASLPPPAFTDNLGIEVASDTFHSQRSALFPWDMAGGSSSISAPEGEIHPPTNDPMSIEHADARLRGSSTSRRGSSLHILSNLQTVVGSPAVTLPAIQSDDDFLFDVPGDDHALESRQSDVNRAALEKNSYNFLEYAKMQYRSLPSVQYLAFDDVVPKTTSTAHVAAAALYHCLVLATKDLVQVDQKESYGRISIRIK